MILGLTLSLEGDARKLAPLKLSVMSKLKGIN